MNTSNTLAGHLFAFLEEHLSTLRGTSRNTVRAYRDALKLLLQYVAQQRRKDLCTLELSDFTRPLVIGFLDHLEHERGNSIATRNHRLVLLRRFFAYIAVRDVGAAQRCGDIVAIPLKRTAREALRYLERDELQHCLHSAASARLSRRDRALLLMLYNTGARAQEIVDLRFHDLQLHPPAQVRLFGKGRKERFCPLWEETIKALRHYLEDGGMHETTSDRQLFLNYRGEPLTRYGLRHIVQKHVSLAARDLPTLGAKRVSPHTFRHTTAMHLLQSGVELNVIRAWLGHVSLTTTSYYIEADLKMKQEALQHTAPPQSSPRKRPRWHRSKALLTWLESL